MPGFNPFDGKTVTGRFTGHVAVHTHDHVQIYVDKKRVGQAKSFTMMDFADLELRLLAAHNAKDASLTAKFVDPFGGWPKPIFSRPDAFWSLP